MSEQHNRSALYDRHVQSGATMGAEALWEVPLSYGAVLDEVATLRRRAAVLDISHVGRLRIRGDDALPLLLGLCTHDVAHQPDDTAHLTCLCNEQGGIIDACYLARLEDHWLLTTSPPCRQKVLDHLTAHAHGLDVKIDDQTAKTVHLAVSGPQAPQLLDAILPLKVSDLPPSAVRTGMHYIARYTALRLSGAGQWGLEVIVPNLAGGLAWDYITRKAGECCIPPAGLAALDVLRIEAGLPRYGHEINETIDPATAGLMSVVDIGRDFLGAPAVRKALHRGPSRRRVALQMGGPAEGILPATMIPRQGQPVLDAEGTEVGVITSGTWSPLRQGALALAYVNASLPNDAPLRVGAEGWPAAITPLPGKSPPPDTRAAPPPRTGE